MLYLSKKKSINIYKQLWDFFEYVCGVNTEVIERVGGTKLRKLWLIFGLIMLISLLSNS